MVHIAQVLRCAQIFPQPTFPVPHITANEVRTVSGFSFALCYH